MSLKSEGRTVQGVDGWCRTVTILLWIAIIAGWLVSVFSVIQEMCMVAACRDTAAFSIFGFNMGWFGIVYFTFLLIVFWHRNRDWRIELIFSAAVFSGIGAEFRLLWIQKYIIGGWCPLCVTICCALFSAAILLVIQKVRCSEAGRSCATGGIGWMGLMLAMSATGLAIAVAGVKAFYY